ncbi:MAG: sodium:proton antiporter, partial [Candidatus Omnitrophica bacterium]|nr:sodium:proton antiporter [Candidatus Omnitrophota bacterium]
VAILFAGIFSTMMPALDWLQTHARGFGKPASGLFYWACGSLSSILDNAPTYLTFLSAVFGSCVDQEVVTQIHQAIQAGDLHQLIAATGPHADQVQSTYLALAKYHSSLLSTGKVGVSYIETAFLLGQPHLSRFILAISIGAVFFGAMTYIGNGPNFMVKAIAQQAKVAHVPGFLGYLFKYAFPFLLPVLIVTWLVFFRQ